MRHAAHVICLSLAIAAQAFAQEQAPPAAPEAAPETAAEPGVAPPAEPAAPAVAPPPLLVAPRPERPAAPLPPAESPEIDDQSEPDDGTLGSHQEHLFAGAGVRTNFVGSESFEPFSESGALPQFGLHAGGVFFTNGPLSIVALGGWDYGQTQSTARGAATQLDVHRLWLGAEARYHLFRRFYGFGRLAPVALHASASLRDNVARVERTAGSWEFGADATLGGAFELFGRMSGASQRVRGWLALAGGYGFVTSSALVFEAEEDSAAPIRTAALDLGDLSLSGPFMRVDFALSF